MRTQVDSDGHSLTLMDAMTKTQIHILSLDLWESKIQQKGTSVCVHIICNLCFWVQ